MSLGSRRELRNPPFTSTKYLLLPTLYLHYRSELTAKEVENILYWFYFPPEFLVVCAVPQQKVSESIGPQVGVCEKVVELGLHFLLHPFLVIVFGLWSEAL